MAERTIVLDGFSKTYAMTGWRMGYAVVPDWLVKPFGQLIINTISGVTAFAQAGAIEALRGPQTDVDAMVDEFQARRDLIVDGLNAIPGFRCLRPQGAFYVFPDISGTGMTGAELAEGLLVRRRRVRPCRHGVRRRGRATTSGSRTPTPARISGGAGRGSAPTWAARTPRADA